MKEGDKLPVDKMLCLWGEKLATSSSFPLENIDLCSISEIKHVNAFGAQLPPLQCMSPLAILVVQDFVRCIEHIPICPAKKS